MITMEIVVEAVLLTIITIVIKMKQKDEVERYYYTVIWIEFLAYANRYVPLACIHDLRKRNRSRSELHFATF